LLFLEPLISRKCNNPAPHRVKNGLVEASLSSRPVIKKLAVGIPLYFRFPDHIGNLQVLEDVYLRRILYNVMADLIGTILTDIALFRIGLTDPRLSVLPALRAFLLVGEFPLQLLP